MQESRDCFQIVCGHDRVVVVSQVICKCGFFAAFDQHEWQYTREFFSPPGDNQVRTE